MEAFHESVRIGQTTLLHEVDGTLPGAGRRGWSQGLVSSDLGPGQGAPRSGSLAGGGSPVGEEDEPCQRLTRRSPE